MTVDPATAGWSARHFDGRSARARTARVRVDAAGVCVEDEAGSWRRWGFAETRMTRGDRAGEPVQLELSGEPIETVIVEDRAFLEALKRALPPGARVQGASGSRVTWRVVLALALALGLLLVLAWRWGIPALAKFAADHVSAEWEGQLGRAVVAQLAPEGMRVADPSITGPVERIHARIADAADLELPGSRVLVVRLSIANAFAVPGGTVVVTTGLLRALGGPEELAAVLAHEIAHVSLRHPVQGLMEHLSADLLLALIAGDGSALSQTLQVAGQLGTLGNSRADEAEADRGAAAMLAAAGISPLWLAKALDSIGRSSRGEPGIGFLSTHPAPADRRAKIERLAASTAVRGPPALLGPDDWPRLVAALPESREP